MVEKKHKKMYENKRSFNYNEISIEGDMTKTILHKESYRITKCELRDRIARVSFVLIISLSIHALAN